MNRRWKTREELGVATSSSSEVPEGALWNILFSDLRAANVTVEQAREALALRGLLKLEDEDPSGRDENEALIGELSDADLADLEELF